MRFRRCGKDRSRVVAQHLEPARDISGVIRPWRVGDAKVGTEERRSEFGDELFHRIGIIAKAIGEIAIETGRMTCPMRLMPISA
jgi:hypothetical protein